MQSRRSSVKVPASESDAVSVGAARTLLVARRVDAVFVRRAARAAPGDARVRSGRRVARGRRRFRGTRADDRTQMAHAAAAAHFVTQVGVLGGTLGIAGTRFALRILAYEQADSTAAFVFCRRAGVCWWYLGKELVEKLRPTVLGDARAPPVRIVVHDAKVVRSLSRDDVAALPIAVDGSGVPPRRIHERTEGAVSAEKRVIERMPDVKVPGVGRAGAIGALFRWRKITRHLVRRGAADRVEVGYAAYAVPALAVRTRGATAATCGAC